MKNDNVKFKSIVNLINTSSGGPMFFIAPNPSRAIGIEREIKNYHIICSQKTDLTDHMRKEGVGVICLDDGGIKNSGKILTNKKSLDYIKEKSENKIANIITFKPSPMIQKVCDNNGFRYLGNDWRLNRKLEDKIKFVEAMNELKIPVANSMIIRFGEDDISDVFLDFENEKIGINYFK